MNPVTTTFVRGFGRSGSHSPLYSGVRAGETTCADICRPCADLCNPKIHPSRTMKGMSECGWLSRREMPSLSLFVASGSVVFAPSPLNSAGSIASGSAGRSSGNLATSARRICKR